VIFWATNGWAPTQKGSEDLLFNHPDKAAGHEEFAMQRFFFLNLAGTQGWPERRRLNWGWVWVRTTSRLLSRIHSLGSWYWCSSCFSQLEMGNCGRCSVASLQKTQRFYTTKRTTWISIDLFWNQICPIFLLKVSTLKKTSFSNFLGLIWRGTQ
jgi:hypothetical protein